MRGLNVTHRSKEAPTAMTPDHRLFSWRARRQDGFTLIELLVVIVILGVLAAIVVFSVRGIGDKGRKSAVAADAATLRTAEESFCAKHGHYGTVEDLQADGLLTGEPAYNMVVVGEEDKCGRGEKSSYTLYDTSTPTDPAAGTIPVGTTPADLAVDETANRVYVMSTGLTNVTVVDGKTDERIGLPIDLSGAVSNPTRIAVDPRTGKVYVGGAGSVGIIDTANANQVTRVAFTTTVSALAVSPDNGDVYVAGGTLNNSAVSYIAAGSTSATPIPLPAAGIVSAANGMDFSFDPERHAVYLAKAPGTGAGANPHIGLFSISTQTHVAKTVKEFPAKTSCSVPGDLLSGSVRGTTVVDPKRNLVYLLARRCFPDPNKPDAWKPVATVIAIDPAKETSTAIDDPVGATYGPTTAVYNSAAGSVYVFSNGGAAATACGTSTGRISRIVGTTVMGQTSTCTMPTTSGGNAAHRMTVLKNFNRVFVAQHKSDAAPGVPAAPGGIAVADVTTLLPHAPLARPHLFGALAVNNATAKVYAVDLTNEKLAVFRTGSV